mgnify:CR=1 FL=1
MWRTRPSDQLLYEARMSILHLKCEVAALRFVLAARRLSKLLLKGGFNPDQPRDDRGRWTDAGAGDPGSGAGDDAQFILIGGPGAQSGYPLDILGEDALGGHTYERHVGKSEEYLKARIVGSRTNVAGIFTVGERRAGSFTSLEAANKLINSTLAQNGNRVDAVAAGRFPPSLPFMFVFADFDSPTGYEAFAPNDRAQPRMRPTYGVTVFIRRTSASEKGYYVHSAWPTNRD